jgi:DNA-binding NarL/FixJ family response regulator
LITVALVEDNSTYRALLEHTLASSERFKLAGSFASAELALAKLRKTPVQIALVDVQLQGMSGTEAVAQLHEHRPATRCVMLTHYDDIATLNTAFAAGAVGYLLKTEPPKAILAALEELMAGGSPMSHLVARRMLASFKQGKSPSDRPAVTRREGEVMKSLSGGNTYKEIGRKLGISTATVKNHLHRIYDKLGVRSRTEAVVLWLKH